MSAELKKWFLAFSQKGDIPDTLWKNLYIFRLVMRKTEEDDVQEKA